MCYDFFLPSFLYMDVCRYNYCPFRKRCVIDTLYVVVFVVDLAFVCECPPYQTRVCVCVWLCDDFLES